MGQLTGKTPVTVNGTEYTLFLGFSGLAELQDRHGQDFLQNLQPPENAQEGWMPPLKIVRDLVLESLQRYHADDADRWLVDDIYNANPDVVNDLIEVSFGQGDDVKTDSVGDKSGNAPGPKKKRP